MIDAVYRDCGQKETVIFCDRIMGLGFYHAFKAGISFGKDDMLIPETKPKILEQTNELVREYEQQYNDGFITQLEKYNKVVDAWSKCTDQIAKEMMDRISAAHRDANGRTKQINSVYMMAHSGARGSEKQMRQLAGMRGLMTKPSGEIIETPIISNFKEGLTVLEYFNSTHGARKGLADTALKTANSGYLTRRLVDVAQDCIINEVDCGTDAGINVQAVVDAGQVIVSLGQRILGRTAAEDVKDPATKKVIVKSGELIGEAEADAIEAAQIQEVRIRSVLTCETTNGVCAKCYGRDLARGTPVNIGEAVGVIAAQSIGEPGTQLTMRTFHMGGVAQTVDQSYIESNFNGTVKIKNRSIGKDSQGRLIAMSRNMTLVIVDKSGKELATQKIVYGARMHVDDGDEVKRGTRLAQWDPYMRPILTEVDGVADFADLVDGVSVKEQTDEMKGTTNRVIVDWRATPRGPDLKPAIVIKESKGGKPVRVSRGVDARYLLPVEAILSVDSARQGEGRRRAGAHPALQRQDRRHHGRSAARGGAVRGAPSEGQRDHRRDLGHGGVRQGLQEQAAHHHQAGRRERRVQGVPDPARQEPGGAARRSHREGRLRLRRPPRAARHPRHQGRRGARQLPDQRDPGRLPAAGRDHQRQAHRGDRPPDAAEGGGRGSRRDRLPEGRAARQDRVRRAATPRWRRRASVRRRPSRCCSASPRPRCRPGASSRRPRSRRPRACSPMPPSTARRTRSRGSRRT